ncbi:MAG: exodeoxyribonuclease I, partial [Rhodobacterales bacterium]|nr:exodeoxyribonuclease I [Rhodobacterales bacterium]
MSNKRGDIINLARSVNYFYPGTLKTSFNEKGKEIFKLEQLASDNIISDQGNNLT